MFQSQTRSQSPGDTSSVSRLICFSVLFQSQTRSQSPGDMACLIHQVAYVDVSIADAKPIPWRAHRNIRNHTYNLRLGATEDLTIAALEQAAAALHAHL